jgi:hypothetical protein
MAENIRSRLTAFSLLLYGDPQAVKALIEIIKGKGVSAPGRRF